VDKKLDGKVAIVTGAAGGIGFGIAQAFAQHGAKVAMIDIQEDNLSAAKEKLTNTGLIAKDYVLDITDQAAAFACFAKIRSDLGPVYALINNAGVVDQRPFEDITPDQIDRMMKVNVNGTLYCCQAAAPDLKANGGRIVNFSSKSGKTGSAMMAHYSAAKGAIIAMTHALAFELAPYKVTVNCVCPGITGSTGVWDFVSHAYSKNMNADMKEIVEKFTAKIPLSRLTEIQDIVDYVLFLVADAPYCTGQAINITGGREVH